MYRNIVFDLGGVVVNYNPKDYLVNLFFHEAIETKIYNAVFGSEEWLLLDKGEIDWNQACEIFLARGQEMDLKLEMQAVIDDWTDMLITRKATVALMRLLKKKGFSLYYLSNMAPITQALLEQRDFWQLFDGGLASHELGLLKPDISIYRALLERYHLVPQETIFTDDMRENAAAAFQAGITGIQFKNVKNFCKMMVTYGIDI